MVCQVTQKGDQYTAGFELGKLFERLLRQLFGEARANLFQVQVTHTERRQKPVIATER